MTCLEPGACGALIRGVVRDPGASRHGRRPAADRGERIDKPLEHTVSTLITIGVGTVGGRQRAATRLQAPFTAWRTVASTERNSSMAICPGAELLLPTAKVAAEP